MLGNDVIDLADPETHTRHPGFDARVFSESERHTLETSPDPHATRQILWAAKESAYKAARRQHPHTIFSPRRFEVEVELWVEFDALGRGQVCHEADVFQVQVTRSGDCIHAVARLGGDPAASQQGIAEGSAADASATVRTLAVTELCDALGVPAGDLRIERQGRIPELHLCGSTLPAPLSFSHHGRYAAYAALL